MRTEGAESVLSLSNLLISWRRIPPIATCTNHEGPPVIPGPIVCLKANTIHRQRRHSI
jgi:hypothetical protein